MQTIPANIQILENPALELPDIIEVKFNGMFPKQEYIVVATNFESHNVDNFNIEHASALQKNIIEKVLGLRHPSLDAVPLVRKISFNKDNNTWRMEIFSIKIKNFGDIIPSRIKDCFDKAMENEGIKINWAIRL